MGLTISCDLCGAEHPVIWGAFDYSPGGGRHGTERFYVCYDCIGDVREFFASRVPEDRGRWQLFSDAAKARCVA